MKKSTTNRSASLAAAMWSKLEAAVMERGGTNKSLQRLASESGNQLIREYALLLLQNEFRSGVRREFTITVDYTKSIEEMVGAGKFEGGTGREITSENYPICGEGVVDMGITLICFDRKIKVAEVNDELRSMGLPPGNLPELLALGARYPDLQKVSCIVAPGARSTRSPRSGSLVPFLTQRTMKGGESERYVSHEFDYSTWMPPTHFLAIRQ